MCSKLPFSKIYLSTPDFWMLVLYYVVIAGIVFLFNLRKIKFLRFALGDGIKRFFIKYYRKIIVVAVATAMLLNLVRLIPQNLRIYFVDVGQR